MLETEFFHIINQKAAALHRAQGQTLKLLNRPLEDAYIENAIWELTRLFQENFVRYSGNPEKQTVHYTVAPRRRPKDNRRWAKFSKAQIFEVKWLIAAFLGLALARQAVVIHKEPRGREPADADRRLVGLTKRFLQEDSAKYVEEKP